MALTIAIEGKGVIANCDAVTNDTGGTGTGDWGEDGGGTLSLTTDTFLFGSSCIAGAYSNKSGYQYFDLGSGNELDFDTGGNEIGQHIYMWIHCPTIGLLETKANKGLAIRLGTSLSDYRDYLIAGQDDANGWNGGWKCFVVDPTKDGSVSDAGSYDYGSIRYVGVWIDTASLAKGDNIFIDQIAVGFGLRITGTSTQGWKDAVDYCTDYPNRAWGMLQEREGIYYAYGKIYIGDAASQSANVSFADSGRVIQFGESEYWNGSAWVTLADIDYSGIAIEDHSSYTTTFTDGVIVGSDRGRSGSVIIGHANHDVELDFHPENNSSSVVACYGTTFKNVSGVIDTANDSDHKYLSCTFESCSAVKVWAANVHNCNFISSLADTAHTGSLRMMYTTFNVSDCNFINPGDYGIIFTYGGSYDFNDIVFSGTDGVDTFDVYNGSFGDTVIITNVRPGTSNAEYYENSMTGCVTTIVQSVTLTIQVRDLDGLPVQMAQCAVYKASDDTQLMNEDSPTSGDATQSYTGTTPCEVYWRVRKSSEGDTRYISQSGTGTITTSGFTVTVRLREDANI